MNRFMTALRWTSVAIQVLFFPFRAIKWIADFALTAIALAVVATMAAFYLHMIPDAIVHRALDDIGQRLLPLVLGRHAP